MTRHRFGKFSRPDFLVPVKALSKIFRAKFRDPLKQTELFTAVEANVWQQAWVVHSEAVGTGLAAFKYLAPYIFRVAISNHRILCLQDGRVTCTFKESAPDQVKRCTVTAKEFIRRFLQHVLPDRFVKVRSFGLLSPTNRHLLQQARQLLATTTGKLQREVRKPLPPRPLLSCPPLPRTAHPPRATTCQRVQAFCHSVSAWLSWPPVADFRRPVWLFPPYLGMPLMYA